MIIVGDRYLQIPDPISSRLLRARWPRPLLGLPAPMIDKSPLDLIFLASLNRDGFLRRCQKLKAPLAKGGGGDRQQEGGSGGRRD